MLAFLLALTAVADVRGAEPAIRIPYGQAPPLTYRDAAGKPDGFIIQTMNEAARRAGMRLEWRRGSTPEGNDRALQENALDLIAGPATEQRRRLFSVSEPWWSSELVAVVAAAGPQSEAALKGKPIAVASSAAVAVSVLGSKEPPLRAASASNAAEAVCLDKVDAGVFAAMFLRELLTRPSKACRDFDLRVLDLSVTSDFSLITRHDTFAVAKRLKSALDDLTADGTLAAIAARNPPMSTPQATQLAERLRTRYKSRLWTFGFAGTAAFGLVMLGAFLRLQRSRRRLKDLNRRLADDLEARTRAEQALRESELRFRTLFDSAPQTVIAVNAQGQVEFSNAKTQSMFGYDPGTLDGEHIGRLFPPRLIREGDPGWWRRLDTAQVSAAPLLGMRKDGTEFPVVVDYGAVPGPGGQVIVFLQDVSERLALERQVREAQRLESIGQLAGGVAHDFNNLLTVISGYSELTLSELSAESALRGGPEKILQAASRAATLTRQLLTFSRRQMTEPRIISLNDLVSQLNAMLRPLIREDIELVVTLNAHPSRILADQGQVELALMNLVVNARDAMPQGGRLTVETQSTPEGDVVLRVADTGIGMSQETQARIFDPFFTTKPTGQGTGLGLSVVYGIVRQNGASISVSSEPHRGSVFEIRFPSAKEDLAATEPEAAAKTEQSLSEPATILLAEDDRNVRDFVCLVLRSHGYTVLESANGREAETVMHSWKGGIDLLLTDTVMPEAGGMALSRVFRQNFPGRPILQMTGYAEAEERDFTEIPVLNKPFSAKELLERVRQALEGDGAAAANPH